MICIVGISGCNDSTTEDTQKLSDIEEDNRSEESMTDEMDLPETEPDASSLFFAFENVRKMPIISL